MKVEKRYSDHLKRRVVNGFCPPTESGAYRMVNMCVYHIYHPVTCRFSGRRRAIPPF